jgi:hypothetical protein
LVWSHNNGLKSLHQQTHNPLRFQTRHLIFLG